MSVETMKPPRWQRVAAAAIKDPDTGKVFSVPAPGRHHDVIRAMCRDHGYESVPGNFPQGFLLADGTFVDRWNARRHAVFGGQIAKAKWGDELYSEDLW